MMTAIVRPTVPLLLLPALLWGGSTLYAQDMPYPVVSEPTAGGTHARPFGSAAANLPAGYVEEERFLSGTARSYAKVGDWLRDGRWEARPADEAPYAVRLLVRRPAEPDDFNGVVVVEWLNVSAMAEGDADYQHLREELLRGGYAWVGVGAQSAGVNAPRTGLKAWDPVRYGPLSHPGDPFSFDIFAQAVRALRHPGDGGPLAGFEVRHVLATGRSQSAMRLITYINALHARDRVLDGYLVHSRGAAPAGLRADRLTGVADPLPAGARIRADIEVPVLDVQAEGDMVTLRSHLARQDPHDHLRHWEIAGAAHAEVPVWVVSEVTPPSDGPGGFAPGGCAAPVNAAPHHAVVKAALRALARWVRDGVAPRQSPRIELGDPADDDPVLRDRFGNARGGIRLPQLEAPTATLDGRANAPAGSGNEGGVRNFCFLFGHTVAFDRETLASLYPSHEHFVRRFDAAVDRLVQDGFLLQAEADEARRAARESPIGR